MTEDKKNKIVPQWQSHVTVVTGTIGSGKSTATEILKELGAFCVSADVLARKALEKGSEGLQLAVQEFGSQILNDDGTLNRRKLGSIVFADANARRKLEAITHPLIADLAAEEFSRAITNDEADLLVYECPLLFETGQEKSGFRTIILVTVDEATCIQRIVNRDKLSEEEARQRLAAQFPIETKKLGSHIIIDNSGTLADLRRQIEAQLPALTTIPPKS